MPLGLGLVGWRWLGVVGAGWSEVGRSWGVLIGMEVVSWGRAHRKRCRVLCASGLELAGPGACSRVWRLSFRGYRSVLGGDRL